MMNLKRECNEVGLSVDDFCQLIEVPYQTVAGWAKSRPVLLKVLFDGLNAKNVVEKYKQVTGLVIYEGLSPAGKAKRNSFPQEREAQ